MKYAVLHIKADFGWNDLEIVCRLPQKTQLGLERSGHNLKLFSKPEKIFKLGLIVSAKALTIISELSPIEFFVPG
ncbi:hypothetical protein EGT49_05095 [Companilactobacillus suantsaicola]|uniref:Uncharacterized protein n=1 Tax=Companilactobacillus suantsaicola TaxID=2487723 RepID=A0A4Z0JPH1_9LACO|nr:hypothetical protein EGT49_05095 [Companilactobacillus suantsaicola]